MLRKATIKDAKQIYSLIAVWAKKGAVLRRSLNYIYENMRDYWIYSLKGRVVGVCALHIVGWQALAEIKSLVVARKYHHRGIAKELIEACLKEAGSLGVERVFALTFIPAFFRKFGFKKTNVKNLPHKIWSDCIDCVYFPDCKEKALEKILKK